MGVLEILLTVLGAIVAILIIAGIIYMILFRRAIGAMTPDESGEAAEGVYLIKGEAYLNMHIIKGIDGYIAIDAGTTSRNIERELARLGIAPGDIAAVFLTHTDYDHVGGIGLFENAKVYMSSAEEQMIDGKTARSFYVYRNRLKCAYKTIEDGEEITAAGLKVKGILIPGHTPGSMAYVVNGRYLFVGDSVRLINKKAVMPERIFTMNAAETRKSIGKLAGLQGIEYVFTAHYGYSDDFMQTFGEYLPQGSGEGE
jgi:hydroxyacylglutathione hydrolase